MAKKPATPPSVRNKRALHHYEVLERLEAGIVLTGSEVKSLRSGRASIEEAWATITGEEVFLRDLNISPYANAGYSQHMPTQERKLLLHRREIKKLLTRVTQKGLTLIPLALYFNERGRVKIELALCRGKQLHDKREDLKARDADREMRRSMRPKR